MTAKGPWGCGGSSLHTCAATTRHTACGTGATAPKGSTAARQRHPALISKRKTAQKKKRRISAPPPSAASWLTGVLPKGAPAKMAKMGASPAPAPRCGAQQAASTAACIGTRTREQTPASQHTSVIVAHGRAGRPWLALGVGTSSAGLHNASHRTNSAAQQKRGQAGRTGIYGVQQRRQPAAEGRQQAQRAGAPQKWPTAHGAQGAQGTREGGGGRSQ